VRPAVGSIAIVGLKSLRGVAANPVISLLLA